MLSRRLRLWLALAVAACVRSGDLNPQPPRRGRGDDQPPATPGTGPGAAGSTGNMEGQGPGAPAGGTGTGGSSNGSAGSLNIGTGGTVDAAAGAPASQDE